MNWIKYTLDAEIPEYNYLVLAVTDGKYTNFDIVLWYKPTINKEFNNIRILCKEKYGYNYKTFELNNEDIYYVDLGNVNNFNCK